MSFYETVEQVHKDWNYGHGRILHSLVRSLKPLICVEVGTYTGFCASWIAKALQENNRGHLFCIDDFSEKGQKPCSIAQWSANLEKCGVEKWATLLPGRSQDVEWPPHVDFAYIDGWHGFTTAYGDFVSAHVAGAKCICLDDTTQSVGPRLLVKKIRDGGFYDVIDIESDCGLAICMRRVPLRPITFSQEDDHTPGLDMTEMKVEARMKHLAEMSAVNKVDYSPLFEELAP